MLEISSEMKHWSILERIYDIMIANMCCSIFFFLLYYIFMEFIALFVNPLLFVYIEAAFGLLFILALAAAICVHCHLCIYGFEKRPRTIEEKEEDDDPMHAVIEELL